MSIQLQPPFHSHRHQSQRSQRELPALYSPLLSLLEPLHWLSSEQIVVKLAFCSFQGEVQENQDNSFERRSKSLCSKSLLTLQLPVVRAKNDLGCKDEQRRTIISFKCKFVHFLKDFSHTCLFVHFENNFLDEKMQACSSRNRWVRQKPLILAALT